LEKILITGGTGFIGMHLSKFLREKGYAVGILSRSVGKAEGIHVHLWEPDKDVIDREAVLGADYIVHLAGAGIGDMRWTEARKKLIINSRVQSTRIIFDCIKGGNNKLKAFISASAIGYYGAVTTERIFKETDEGAHDFPGETCRIWEKAADPFGIAGIRTVKIRTGIVLASDGGILKKMRIPAKAGIMPTLGSGKQYMPWIHMIDLCGIYLKAIEDTNLNGAYNAVAPEHITNHAFTATLSKTLSGPDWLPNIPEIFLKIRFGEMASMILQGSRVSSEKISDAGFRFKFPELKGALEHLLKFNNNPG
jgi:uncharacterized protein (TIGR01777 family)